MGAGRSGRLVGFVGVLGCARAGGDAGSDNTSDASSASADERGTSHGDASTTEPSTTEPSTTEASTTGPSTTEASASESSSTGAPIGTMPVFVALADGGWLASSCDRGHTWTTHAFSDEVGDHTQWTAFGGLAYGQGAFVAGLGWGAEGGHVLRSFDARTWEDLPAESFVDDGMVVGYAIYTSGVAATTDALHVFSQRVWRSTDGTNWLATLAALPPGAEQLRQLRGFAEAGLLVAAVESQSGTAHPQGNFVVVSDDEGATWSEGSGYASSCSSPIQHWGDIELVGDTLLVAADDMCRSPDRGATWELVGQPTGAAIQDLLHDDRGFLAVSGTRIFRSTDGSAWSELGDTGVPLRAAAWADGAYAAISGDGASLLWSDDGVSWSAGALDRAPTGERWVRDFLGVAIEGHCDR